MVVGGQVMLCGSNYVGSALNTIVGLDELV
jgi:hypothetical protein